MLCKIVWRMAFGVDGAMDGHERATICMNNSPRRVGPSRGWRLSAPNDYTRSLLHDSPERREEKKKKAALQPARLIKLSSTWNNFRGGNGDRYRLRIDVYYARARALSRFSHCRQKQRERRVKDIKRRVKRIGAREKYRAN